MKIPLFICVCVLLLLYLFSYTQEPKNVSKESIQKEKPVIYSTHRERAIAEGVPLIKIIGGVESKFYRFEYGRPKYIIPIASDSLITSHAHKVTATSPFAVDGSGWRIGLWDDAAPRTTHQEFGDGLGGSRIFVMDGTTEIGAHATLVSTIATGLGIDSSAAGHAPGVRMDAYDADESHVNEISGAAADSVGQSDKLYVSLHPYVGSLDLVDAGVYGLFARDIDQIANNNPYFLSFWGAGNFNDEDTADDFDNLGGGWTAAKNVVTVGGTTEAISNQQRDLSSVSIWEESSRGPADDGRIKPDLVANATTMLGATSTADDAYRSSAVSGTSYSTPSVGASALLLQDYYESLFTGQAMRASTLKALLIHTADDLGNAGPDYTYGWGLVNAARAAQVIMDFSNSEPHVNIIEDQLTNIDTSNTHTIDWTGQAGELVATLVWNDPAGTSTAVSDDRTPKLVNDLDLSIDDPNVSTHFPFVMPYSENGYNADDYDAPATTGTNTIDNVEQIRIQADGVNGTYTITVAATGVITGLTQRYSLILSSSLGYDSWARDYWPGEPTTADAQLSADPDADGHTNLQEYAFGMNPLVASDQPWDIGIVQDTNQYISVHFPLINDSLLSYTVQISNDLITPWADGATYTPQLSTSGRDVSTNTVQVNEIQTANGWIVEERTNTTLDAGDPRFMRVQVEKP